jgi:hypothetical protein
MSLQFEASMNTYAQNISGLWATWRGKSTNQLFNEAITAIRSCTTFLPAIDYRPYTTADWGDYGVQYPSLWRIDINRHHAMFDDIELEDFIEWVITPYHESRHAEQTYRVAQGVLCGEITLPGKDLANRMQAAMVGRSPREIARAFETGRPLEVVDSVTRKRIVQDWLDIPMAVIDHADAHRSYFQNFLQSSTPAWLDQRRDPLKNAVIDWMKASYDHHLGELDRKAQNFVGEHTETGGYARFYETLPEEKDAYGIEGAVKTKILANIGKSLPADAHDTPP